MLAREGYTGLYWEGPACLVIRSNVAYVWCFGMCALEFRDMYGMRMVCIVWVMYGE